MNENDFNKKKNDLMNLILNTDYTNEDEIWDLALELEHMSIYLRATILKTIK